MHQNERVKNISASETEKLLEEIIVSYEKCEKSTKVIMGSIISSLRDIGLYDVKCKGIFENPDDVYFETTFIPKHCSMFMKNNNKFQPVDNHNDTSEITITNTTQRRKQQHFWQVTEIKNMKKKAKKQK